MSVGRKEVSDGARPGALKELFEAYVRAAMDYLGQFPQGSSLSDPRVLEWTRYREGIFRQEVRRQHHWEPYLVLKGDELQQLPQCKALVRALRQDPVVNIQLDAIVGSALGGASLQTRQVTDHLIRELARKNGLAFDAAEFEIAYAALDSALRSEAIEHCHVAPFLGLKLQSAPVAFEEGVELDRLTDSEIVRALDTGVIPARIAGPPFVNVGEAAGLRVRTTLPKKTGEDLVDVALAREFHDRGQKRVAQAIRTLRVLKPGRVVATGIMAFMGDALGRSSPIESRQLPALSAARVWAASFELTEQDAAAALELWPQVAAPHPAYLEVALRRFSDAAARETPEDEIIDLMIAAEALFLTGVGDEKERGELRYRLALRSAFYVDGEWSRLEVFEHMKRAYEVRSKIVHGGSADKALRRGQTLRECVDVTEAMIRAALLRAIRQARSRDSVMDWEREILGEE